MGVPVKPQKILSSGFVRMKMKDIREKKERKKALENYLAHMAIQREAQKKSRSSVEDTDDAIRFLELELAHLKS